MRIENYASGSHMRIAGQTYRKDLKIVDGRVRDNWWRDQGHRLEPSDIEDILQARPGVLVIGTGYAGAMRVPSNTLASLAERGIRVIAEPTAEAVKTYNRFAENGDNVAGAFHLTC